MNVVFRYTAENSVKYGAPRDTENPELRQPLALEIWDSVIKSLDPGSKVTILTNGPLTTLAKIILSGKNLSCIKVSQFLQLFQHNPFYDLLELETLEIMYKIFLHTFIFYNLEF